jgi:hypothetical protein
MNQYNENSYYEAGRHKREKNNRCRGINGCVGLKFLPRGPTGLTYEDIVKLKISDLAPGVFMYYVDDEIVVYNNGKVMSLEEYTVNKTNY